MPDPVYRTLELLCAVVSALPIGTNLGLLHLLWMLVSGRLLTARGAVFPGLSEAGLSPAESRRAWTALGQGRWSSERLLWAWARVVEREGRWQAAEHGGYRPVAADVTGFWRPRLTGCPTKHYSAEAGRALPAITLGLVVRVGQVAGQRLALPLALVRADPADPSPRALVRHLVREAVRQLGAAAVLVCDREFGVALLQEEQVPRYLARLPKNFTARRANPPPYRKRGRPPTRGELVRPLPRQRSGRTYPATTPDEVVFWTEGRRTVRAEVWRALVLPDVPADSPTFSALAIHDPRYREPLLLATPLPLTPAVARALYRDRWPVEQLPLAGKQMVGPRASSSTLRRLASACPNSPCWPVPASATPQPPAQPSRPASGTATPSPLPAACAGSSPASLFRPTSRCPRGSARNPPPLPSSRRDTTCPAAHRPAAVRPAAGPPHSPRRPDLAKTRVYRLVSLVRSASGLVEP